MNDCITTTKQSTTKPCAYFLGYTVVNYCSYVVIILLRDDYVVQGTVSLFSQVVTFFSTEYSEPN